MLGLMIALLAVSPRDSINPPPPPMVQDQVRIAPPAPIWQEPVPWKQNWNPTEVTENILSACGITPGFFQVERQEDDRARVQQSSSVTSSQSDCATSLLKDWKIATTATDHPS